MYTTTFNEYLGTEGVMNAKYLFRFETNDKGQMTKYAVYEYEKKPLPLGKKQSLFTNLYIKAYLRHPTHSAHHRTACVAVTIPLSQTRKHRIICGTTTPNAISAMRRCL